MKNISWKQKAVLILSAFFICVAVIEVALRLTGAIFLVVQRCKNSAILKDETSYRILCLGESTTAMGGINAYPNQLNWILDQKLEGKKIIYVMNEGQSGVDTDFILKNLENNLEKTDPHLVITMMGGNDTDDTQFFDSHLYSIRLVKWIILSCQKKIGDMEIKRLLVDAGSGLEDPRDYKKLYRYYHDRWDVIHCIETLRMMIKNDPTDGEVYRDLALLYAQIMDFDEAAAVIEEVRSIDPQIVGRIYYDIGVWVFRYQGDHKRAMQFLKKSLEADPDGKSAKISLAVYYIFQKRFKQAEEILLQSIKGSTDKARLYGILAVAYDMQGKYDLAEKYYLNSNEIWGNAFTWKNYQKLAKIVTGRGIKLVCMPNPMQSLVPLKDSLYRYEKVIFIDNERIFREAVRENGYDIYFKDMYGGNYGHLTVAGNRLLAENVAERLIEEGVFE